MSSKRKPYNTFTKEFKLEALRMMDGLDRPFYCGRFRPLLY